MVQVGSVNLSGYLWMHQDANGALTINELRDSTHTSKWHQMPSNYLQTGYKNDYYWVKLTISTTDANLNEEGVLRDDWYFWLDATIVQEVKFYVFDEDKMVFSDTLGIDFPFYQRKILTRYPVVPLRFGKGQKLTIYASFHNDVSSLKGFLRLTTKSELPSG